MKTYIALLRGINVGGKNKILMAELRSLLVGMGLENVKTYIQSGNILFNAEDNTCVELETQINIAILSKFNLDVPVLVKTPEDLQHIFDSCPFSEEEKQNSYFMMLYSKPENNLVETVLEIEYQNERVNISGSCIYFYASHGYGRTKYNTNFFERKLKVTATARNYKTMLKLLELSHA
ncbi:DUF1697 domain-containing protein [Algibacter miyuki]|uniref:DUF1697 domain-containing protein n=1 Tax=Algibacter miyuki TaxID=1306933 RepID=A0ABV5GY07_9FLAO|nr:DUF1697 domain-containing protein [Algibacter miyuki]MDN3664334.1 DUF1697 domain-containing protein [Algibacter miyuki]